MLLQGSHNEGKRKGGRAKTWRRFANSLHFASSTILPFLRGSMNYYISVYLGVKKGEECICHFPFQLSQVCFMAIINTPSPDPNTHTARLHANISNVSHDISCLRSNKKASGRKAKCTMWE